VDVWSHAGKLYDVVSGHSLPDNGWRYELTGLTGEPGDGPFLSVLIPDATPGDGPFTPAPADDVMVLAFGPAPIPWPILRRFMALVESSGDIVTGPGPAAADAQAD
jgi:hypothetical protein